MRLGLRLLLVASLSLNAGLLGVGIYRAVADSRGWPEEESTDVAATGAEATGVEATGMEAHLGDPAAGETPAGETPGVEASEVEPPDATRTVAPGPWRHAWQPRAAGQGPGAMRAARQWPKQRLGRLHRALHLTLDQRRHLEQELVPLHGQIQQITRQLAQARALLITQLASDRVDADTARALQARLSRAQARLDSLVTEAMLREHAVLDARQRLVHAQMLRTMAGPHGGRVVRPRSPALTEPIDPREDDEED